MFEVIVGNVGTVYTGEGSASARHMFESYRAMSRDGYGRVAHESVTLFDDGEILDEFDGESE